MVRALAFYVNRSFRKIHNNVIRKREMVRPAMVPRLVIDDPRRRAVYRVAHRWANEDRVIVDLRVGNRAGKSKHITAVVLADVVTHNRTIIKSIRRLIADDHESILIVVAIVVLKYGTSAAII